MDAINIIVRDMTKMVVTTVFNGVQSLCFLKLNFMLVPVSLRV